MSITIVVHYKPILCGLQFLVCIHVMRRPFWYTKQWKMAPHVLRKNRIKFPKVILLHGSGHQHGRRDVRCKPSIYYCPLLQSNNLWVTIERFSNECRKTKTKLITLANQEGRRQSSKPIKTRSNYT